MKSLRKIPEIGAIFTHVAHANAFVEQGESVLQVSINSKAEVKLDNLSRGGKVGTSCRVLTTIENR
ncbi:MAG: hypothetical protein AAFU84_17335 [Cyanobacteria bacterium J06633_23]